MYNLQLFKNLLYVCMAFSIFTKPICYAEEVQDEIKLPDGKVVYNEYKDAELIKIADLLYQSHRHTEAAEACQKALSRNLTNDQAASIKHILAKTYEAIPDHGQDAKDTYLQIIQEHPAYEKIPDVAYRLGELNTCIIPTGTEPDIQKAVDCLSLVIKRLPVESADDATSNVTYLSLKAHMMLGNIYLGQSKNDEAKKCFRTIFDCDINKAVPLQYEKFETEKEKQEQMDWLKDRITNMKKRIPTKLVASCISSDIGKSMQRLSQLQGEYPDNKEVNELISEELNKLNRIEEIIDRQINDPNTN